jgi:tetratricopeptide (TPR) repeat protein
MSFNCQTPSCAIAISKAEFPEAMNCPVCQTPLSEVVDSLSQEDMDLISSLPYVIAFPLQQTLLEKHLPQRINLFKDTFLNYLKYLGLLSASEFFNSDIKDKGMVLLFQQNLIETAFGKWNHYIRESLKFLKEQNHTLFCPELATYYELVETGNKSKKHKGEIEFIDTNGDIQLKKQEATSIGMLINFRNRYLGHGLTLDAQKAEELWQEYFPIFRNLLEQLSFAKDYPMLKREDGITYLLHSSEIITIDSNSASQSSIWIQNKEGKEMDILPFFIVPGEVSLAKEDKEQMLTYESYTGKTIKFFSPEGTEKQTSGKLLEKLNLLLRDKQKEVPLTPQQFTKEEFLNRIADENKLLLETLINEKKIIPGVYQHREEMEIKLREWIGARANIFFIAAEAGSGKTNLLAEIQKQYTERDLPSLLIRAGRMEKQTLKEQISYLLNIDLQQGLEKYTSLAGTQAAPTFILIDGLNEANHAETIWQEILSLSTIFEPGSLKFVLTNRANTKADLERYLVSDKEQEFLYGENKDNEKGLGAYAYWLTALDMKEMKGAWENYVAKDKARFKPQFTFDTIAEFDRGIYNQINNPLILRLFLEIYNGKPLPKKGNKHLHIWSDWLKTFSDAEQTFFILLASAVWEKGENELLLDDLLNNQVLKPYFTSDVINAPYQRLKNLGWISSYTKDLNSYVGFTVEGSLLYLLGKKLQTQSPTINLEDVNNLLQTNNKLKIASIEAVLCEEALMGNLDLVSELIDAENQDISICTTPLLFFLKAHGVKTTIEKILEKPTERDWKALLKLNEQLEELQLHVLRKAFLIEVMQNNDMKNKQSLSLALKAISTFDKDLGENYLKKIDTSIFFLNENVNLLIDYGSVEEKNGNYKSALDIYIKCLDIQLNILDHENCDVADLNNRIGGVWLLIFEFEKAMEFRQKSLDIYKKILGGEHPSVAILYNNIGLVWHKKGEKEKALVNYQKSLDIQLKNHGGMHLTVAILYNNIGGIYRDKNDYERALEYYDKSLIIRLKTNNSENHEIATLYNNIGGVWSRMRKYEKALEYYDKCLLIRLKYFGDEHPSIATLFNNIGGVWRAKSEFNLAQKYYKKCLDIRLKTLGGEHPEVAESYFSLGNMYKYLLKFDLAIVNYKKGFLIDKKGGFPFKIAQCYEALNQFIEALDYYIQSAEIRINHPKLGLDNEVTQESISNAKRIAKELNKENELPDWMKK